MTKTKSTITRAVIEKAIRRLKRWREPVTINNVLYSLQVDANKDKISWDELKKYQRRNRLPFKISSFKSTKRKKK